MIEKYYTSKSVDDYPNLKRFSQVGEWKVRKEEIKTQNVSFLT
jgi:hypothetical protein